MANTKQKIMRRVYAIWLTRKAFNPLTFKAGVIALFVWQFTAQVHIVSVLENAQLSAAGSFVEAIRFFEAAVFNTSALTLILMLGIAVFGALFAKEVFLGKRMEFNRRKAFAQI